MFQRILVPLDGSLRAEHALPLAAQIARISHGVLLLLRVVSPRAGGYSYLPSAALQTMLEVDRAEANGYLEMMTASSELCDIQTETDVRSGPAAATILSLAEAHQVDLIVLCRYGQTGRTCWPLGGVAEKVIHGAGMPVLLVPNAEWSSRRVQSETSSSFRVIVPLDGSYRAEAALLPATALAMALSESGRATVCLAQVVKWPSANNQPEDPSDRSALAYVIREGHTYLRCACDRLSQSIGTAWNLTITCSVFPGSDVAETLLRTSEQSHSRDDDDEEPHHGYDLIAMTTYGRDGRIQPGVVGSIIGRILRATALPLLSVCPPEVTSRSQTTFGQPSATLVSDGKLAPFARFSG